MAKSSKERDRRAVVEQLRKQQQAQERRRTLMVVVACVLVGGLIIGFALVQYLEQRRKENRDLSDIGVTRAAASCQPITRKNAQGSGQHEQPGTKINYPEAPPAFGKHWGNFLQGSEIKNIYSVQDRPPVERLVHSLEHGYNVLWYDETIGADTQAMDDLHSIAAKYPVGDYLIIAPWTKADGAAFPDDTHVALTHWTGPDNQRGVWEYCGAVSGPVVQEFADDYRKSNAPEPNAA